MSQNIVKKLDKDFSDMKKGDMMLISSPEVIAKYIKKIPKGKTVTPKQMRVDLARNEGADNTCPLTTGIFLRKAIEKELGDLKIDDSPLPFWRVVDKKNKVLKKLGIDPSEITRMRQLEQKTTS